MNGLTQIQLTELCHSIDLPAGATEAVLSTQSSADFSSLLPSVLPLQDELLTPGTWDDALKRIKAFLGEDPLGMKILTFMLLCSPKTWERYQELGISRAIFTETLKCFTRFINEHLESYGTFGFDRDFWTMRQLSARLFRLGTLEFELTEDRGQKAVHVHIPSDADLSPQARHRSYDTARDFIARLFPAYEGVPFLCTSWLLSPALKECLPESTTLQRNLKKYLLAGGRIGEAAGVLDLHL